MATSKEFTAEDDVQNIMRTIDANCESARKHAVRDSERTIFRVPAHICRGREDLFRPHLLSVGPYHRGKEELQVMEKFKWQFLLEIRERSPGVSKACVQRLMHLEERARACYYHEVPLNRHEFIEMLLLDGCFILQLFINFAEFRIDNFLERGWNSAMLRVDLLLLENQIPFFVLSDMFDLISTIYAINRPLNEIAMDYLMPWDYMAHARIIPPPNISSDDIHHLLHLFYCHYVQRPAPATSNSQRGTHPSCFVRSVMRVFSICRATLARPPPEMPVAMMPSATAPLTPGELIQTLLSVPSVLVIPSATALVEAGVTFRKKRAKNFLDINFKNGTLEIPPVTINEIVIQRMANLLALEQCVNVGREITSYTAFMNYLMDTPDDVEILRRKGIIGKMKNSSKELADFFNQLWAYSLLDFHSHYLFEVFKEVDDYFRSSWHENRARLVRDYFSNPWASISLVAAMVLLSLTLLQTFMSFYSYYHNPSS